MGCTRKERRRRRIVCSIVKRVLGLPVKGYGLAFVVAGFAALTNSAAGGQGGVPRSDPSFGSIRPLSQLDKIKQANAAMIRSGIKRIFSNATPLMTWGFNAANNSNIGTLKPITKVESIDLMAKNMVLQATDLTQYERPIVLDVAVLKGHFYMVDVYCKPSTSTQFHARSNRTSSGANYTTQYTMSLTSEIRHFVFVMQAHGTADGTKNGYRIELGADKPWTFEKIELTKVE